MKEEAIIWAVVRYPKKIRNAESFDFVIYSKQSSNVLVMKDYFEEQKNRHGEACWVHLVSREKAARMKQLWFEKLRERDAKIDQEVSMRIFGKPIDKRVKM